jgi:hypothetical protein
MKLDMDSTNPSGDARQQAYETGSTAMLDRDRRRRARIESDAVGYLVRDDAGSDEPWEVRIQDVSRLGVAFISGNAMKPSETCRIRIGMGPMRLARQMRVVSCQPASDTTYRIGAEFA